MGCVQVRTVTDLALKKEAPLRSKRGSIIPAASYSPTGPPLQYHRL